MAVNTWKWLLLFVLTNETSYSKGITLKLTGSADYGIVNEDYTFTCEDSNSTQGIRWDLNGNDIATVTRHTCNNLTDGSDVRFRYSCNDNEYTLTIPGKISIFEGINGTVWSCRNLYGGAFSNNKTLFIYSTKLKLFGSADHGYVNEDYTFTCVDSNSTLGIIWDLNDKDISVITRHRCNKPVEVLDIRFSYSCNSSGYTLTIPGEILMSLGINGTVWSCRDLIGEEKSDNKTLFVFEKAKIQEAHQNNQVEVSVSTQNSETDFKENDLINITCTVEKPISDHVIWTDKPISNNVTWTFTHLNNTLRQVKMSSLSETSLSNSYTIHRARCEDMGKYSCVFWTDTFDYVKESLNITVSCKPLIQLKSSSNRIMAKPGGTVVLSVLVSAFPKPQINWKFYGRPGVTSSVTDIETQIYLNRHLSSVNISRLQDKDFGTYVVKADNSEGYTIYEIMVIKAEESGTSPPAMLQHNDNNVEENVVVNELHASSDVIEMGTSGHFNEDALYSDVVEPLKRDVPFDSPNSESKL